MISYICSLLVFAYFVELSVANKGSEESKAKTLQFPFRNPAVQDHPELNTLENWFKQNNIDVKGLIEAHRKGEKKAVRNAETLKDEDEYFQGYWEVPNYGEEECTFKVSQVYVKLNHCSPYSLSDESEGFIQIKIEKAADREGKHKHIGVLYADDQCASLVALEVFATERLGECSDGSRSNIRDAIPKPHQIENHKFVFIGAYDSPENCLRNDAETGLIGATYSRKNFCTFAGLNDVFISGCDVKGRIVSTTYPSALGECTLTDFLNSGNNQITLNRVEKGGWCNDPSKLNNLGIKVYLNFECDK